MSSISSPQPKGAARRERHLSSQRYNAVPWRHRVRENGKSTLIVVEYKPLLPAFVTVDYCLLLAKTTVSITNTVINIMVLAEKQCDGEEIFEPTLQNKYMNNYEEGRKIAFFFVLPTEMQIDLLVIVQWISIHQTLTRSFLRNFLI